MNESNLPKKILVVDDDPSVATSLEAALKRHNIQVIKALNLDTALYLFNQQRIDVALIELEFEPVNGLVVIQKFRASSNEDRRNIGVVIMSGQGRKKTSDALLRELGDMEFIDKPIVLIKLLPFLARALERKNHATKVEEVRTIAYDILKKRKSVESALKEIDARLPAGSRAQINLKVELLEKAGNIAEAIAVLKDAVGANPDDIQYVSDLGRLYLQNKQLDEARKFLEQADRAAPQNLDRVKNLATLYLEARDPDKSAAKMKEMIALNPEIEQLRFDLFKDLTDAGFQQHAISLCKETTQPGQVVRFYNNKGVIHSKEGARDKALQEYYTALIFYPTFKENYRILFNIALAEAATKSHEGYLRAKEALEKCILLKPDFDKAKNLLQQINDILAAKFPPAAPKAAS